MSLKYHNQRHIRNNRSTTYQSEFSNPRFKISKYDLYRRQFLQLRRHTRKYTGQCFKTSEVAQTFRTNSFLNLQNAHLFVVFNSLVYVYFLGILNFDCEI